MRHDLLVAGLLAAAILAVYAQVARHEFIDLDDNIYVSENWRVQQGLTWSGAAWAFTTGTACNWHPLTWLSHMLDCQLFGLRAGWHHMVNVVLHVLNSVLLFVVLTRLTGARWRSAVAAALFALHPLHVESVAWVSERKDVLSTLLWMLTLAAYASYAARPGWLRYGLVVLLLALGLMAKPMLVSLPLVLLLVDWWPLRRLGWNAECGMRSAELTAKAQGSAECGVQGAELAAEAGRAGECPPGRALRIAVEKAPLALLAAASCAVTLYVQQPAMRAGESTPLAMRLQNAAVSYVAYLWKMFWPARLAPFYPYPKEIPAWQWGGSAAVLAAITVLVFWAGRCRRYLVVGWLWYLITLVPVIGIVQVGSQAMADRFTYVPLVGIFVAVVWGAADAVGERRAGRVGLAVAAGAVLIVCAAATFVQAGRWRDTQTLFEHALRATEGNCLAHTMVGHALVRQGRLEEATAHYGEALRLRPWNAEARNGLGLVLARQGRQQEAIEEFHRALASAPGEAPILSNLGNALLVLRRWSEAEVYYRRALERDPHCAPARVGLGCILLEAGRADAAAEQFLEAMRLVPDSAEPYYNLGNVRTSQGRPGEAVALYQEALRRDRAHAAARANLANAFFLLGRRDEAAANYREALRARPEFLPALTGLVWVLATDPAPAPTVVEEAVRLAERAVAITARRDVLSLDALAAAYAQAGRFAEAVAVGEEAASLAATRGSTEHAAAVQRRLAAYRAGRPWRMALPAVAGPEGSQQPGR